MALDSLIPIFGILLVMIPVAGLTLVLTLRLAVRPFVETLADALRDSRPMLGDDVSSGQLEELRRQMESLTREVRALRSGTDTDRSLPVGLGTGGRLEGVKPPGA